MPAVVLEQLAAAIESIQDRTRRARLSDRGSESVSTGWLAIDAALGGSLARGALHEWFGLHAAQRRGLPLPSGEGWGEGEAHNSSISAHAVQDTEFLPCLNHQPNVDYPTLTPALSLSGRGSPGRFAANDFAPSSHLPPLTVLIHLAWRAIEAQQNNAQSLIVWIGRTCWPHPRALIGGGEEPNHRLLERSLFVDPPPPDDASRLWAIDLVLRSPAVTAVIADGSNLDMSATRRLQLAAETGGALALLVRPPKDLRLLSSAATRWIVNPAPGVARLSEQRGHFSPRWIVQLLRCKGVRPVMMPGPTCWALELNHATGTLDLAPELVHRSAATA